MNIDFELIKTVIGVIVFAISFGLFLLHPFNLCYQSKKRTGRLDPNKSFLENFFSVT